MSSIKPEDDDLAFIESLLGNVEFLDLIVSGALDDDFFEVRKDLEAGRFKEHSSRSAAPRHRNRCYALDEMDQLSDSMFQRMFRLNRSAFEFLLGVMDDNPAFLLRKGAIQY